MFCVSKFLKCASTFLNGTYSPSSGPINFSLTEAKYVSYSISFNPNSLDKCLATEVFPLPEGPLISQ